MKLCHLSDSHLGAGENHPRRAPSGLKERQEDIIRAFTEAVDGIIQIKPDVCIHSGDLFHTVRPINRIMAIAAEQLHRLAVEAGIPTIVIAGNHDAPRQPYVGAALEVFEPIDNLFIAASGRLEVFEIGGAAFFALPHCLTAESLKTELAKCQPKADVSHNVLILHGVAAGMPEFSMLDLAEQELPLDVMARFDYTALGHYHNHVTVAPRAVYAGSTERLSQSERLVAKGFLEVDLEPFEVIFHEVAARTMVDVVPVQASGKHGGEVLREIREKLADIDSSDKIIRLRVEGASPEMLKTLPPEAISELKQKAYALDIRFEKSKTDTKPGQFGRAALGRLDHSFVQYLETVDLEGLDRERLIRQALEYLQAEE